MRLLSCLFLLLLAHQTLLADRDPSHHNGRTPQGPRPVAILYSDPNYQGDTLEIKPGDEIRDLREIRFSGGSKANDRVSSIRIFGGLRLTVYADPGCRGDHVALTDDVPDLRRRMRPTPGVGTWDDTITAVRAEQSPGGDRPERDRDYGQDEQRRPDREQHGRRGPVCVILYADPNFQGDSLELVSGDEIRDLREIRFPGGGKVNDRVSSIRIRGGLPLTIYADPEFRGDQVRLTDDIPDLRRRARPSPGAGSWDDCITAVRVGGGSPDRGRSGDRD